MIPNELLSIPVCSLRLRKEEKMSKSKCNNNKRLSSLYGEDCLSPRKKNRRQPLRCKKNVINVNRTFQVGLEKYREPCSVEKDKLYKSPKQSTHLKCRSSNNFEMDILSNVSHKKFLKSPKQALRSSSRFKGTLHSDEDPLGINISLEESLKLPKRASRSSSRHKVTLQSTGDPVVGKNIFEKESLKLQKRASRSSLRHKGTLDINEDPVVDKNTSEDKSLRPLKRASKSSSAHKIVLHSSGDPVIDKHTSVEDSLNPPKRALRSSSGHKGTLHINRDPVVDKNISEKESLKPLKRTSRSSLRNKGTLDINADDVVGKKASEEDSLRPLKRASRHKLVLLSSGDPLVDKYISKEQSLKLPKRASRSSSGNNGTLHISGDPEVAKNMPEEEFLKLPKRASRSSLRRKGTLHVNDNPIIDNNTSELKSKGKQNVFSKNTSQISQIISLKSSNKTKTPLFYRNDLTPKCNWKSNKQTEIFVTTLTNTVPVELATKNQESQKDVNLSIKLRSQGNSNNAQQPSAQETKHVKNTAVTPKIRKLVGQQTRMVKRLSKHPSLFHPPKHKTNMRSKGIRKSRNLQAQVRSNSFSGNIPIDDLALSQCRQRKTKSEGFKYPGRNTLKRKRFVMNAMRRADEEYEDDIFETKEFADFKQFFPDLSDSDLSSTMATPKLGFNLTPIIHSKTPLYKDCFSPTEYALSRKVAEACLYRNKKRKNNSEEEVPEIPKKKLEFNKALENACKVQKKVDKLIEDKSDNEDSYFTDLEI